MTQRIGSVFLISFAFGAQKLREPAAFPSDRRLAMRGLPGILRKLVERDENRFAMFGNGRDLCIGRHDAIGRREGDRTMTTVSAVLITL